MLYTVIFSVVDLGPRNTRMHDFCIIFTEYMYELT